MKRYALASLLLLAACGQQPLEPSPPPPVSPADAMAETPNCFVEGASEWRVGEDTYRIETQAAGETCATGIANIRLISPSGAVVFAAEHPVSQVPLAFSGVEDATRLQTEISAWAANVAESPTAAGLPAWPEGADKPPHFAPTTARVSYEGARAAQRPLFCYPDGGESNACVALDPEAQTALLLGSWTPEAP